MDEWWQQQVASGFAAFQGARVAGTVPVRDRLLNELIQAWLAQAAGGEARPADAPSSPARGPDAAVVARLIRKLEVHAADGVVTVDFEVGV